MSGYVAAFGKPYSRVFTHPKTVGTIAAFCLNRGYRPSLGCVSDEAIGQHLELHFYKRGSRSQYSHVYNKTQLQVLRLQLHLKCNPNQAYSRVFYPNLWVLLATFKMQPKPGLQPHFLQNAAIGLKPTGVIKHSSRAKKRQLEIRSRAAFLETQLQVPAGGYSRTVQVVFGNATIKTQLQPIAAFCIGYSYVF